MGSLGERRRHNSNLDLEERVNSSDADSGHPTTSNQFTISSTAVKMFHNSQTSHAGGFGREGKEIVNRPTMVRSVSAIHAMISTFQLLDHAQEGNASWFTPPTSVNGPLL